MAPRVPNPLRREQRQGTRQAMVWGAGAALVVFVAVLVWAFVTAPNGQLGGTTRQTPSPSTGVLANQGAGESQAGKSQAVTPRQNPVIGSGQNSSGEAADIEQSAKPLQLTDDQRGQIRSYFAGKPADRQQSVGFSVAIGAAVPQQGSAAKIAAADFVNHWWLPGRRLSDRRRSARHCRSERPSGRRHHT